jgi:ribosomal protein L7/L12
MPPISTPDELTDAARALADGGKTIEATRQYRVETGAGVKEAKRATTHIDHARRSESDFGTPRKRGGQRIAIR